MARTLDDWLAYIERQHPATIDLGLDRVRAVAERLQLTQPAERTIVVAGTNGKGSTVAFLEAIARAAGWRTGAYTSPHLLRYNERVRIDGHEADDASLVEAFDAVEAARGDTSLTYFEYGTLAALWLFDRAALDLAILEVGLGGRLDAVNLVDADVAVITTVDLDHQDWLGNDREVIGAEKAGIGRSIENPTSRQRHCAASTGSKKKSQFARIADAPMRYARPSTLDGGSSSPSTSGFQARAMPTFSAPMASRSSPR